jgi:hypothetical protein
MYILFLPHCGPKILRRKNFEALTAVRVHVAWMSIPADGGRHPRSSDAGKSRKKYCVPLRPIKAQQLMKD